MRFIKEEEGQAVILVAVAMSLFLVAAIGLAVDGSHLYAQRQMAQSAADAAAQAGMMSIFDGTNAVTTNPAKFTAGTAFTCGSSDARTPCAYANENGFDASTGDTVSVSFPAAPAGVGNLSSDPFNVMKVTVTRSVSTTLLRLIAVVAPTATNVTATATAAIVAVVSPTPILVTDPSNSQSLYLNGNTSITICGGPTRSIQVNSSNSGAYRQSGTIDLSHAGPLDPGDCSAGTGADMGVWGGPTTAPGSTTLNLGTLPGKYIAPSSPVQDPLANVPAPTEPTTNGTSAPIANGVHGCAMSGGCIEYTPGKWPILKPGNNNVIFDPGLYYVTGGGVDFKQTTGGGGAANNYNAMCVGCTADPNTGSGMVIYDTVADGTAAYPASRPTGGFTIDTLVSITLQGATLTTTNAQGGTVPASPYYGILFWEDRTANAHTKPPATNQHNIGAGNGCFTLIGTIYITNTQAIMAGDSTHVQQVIYHGTPCSTTVQQGYIIVSDLELDGTTAIKMNLSPYGYLTVRQVALVG